MPDVRVKPGSDLTGFYPLRIRHQRGQDGCPIHRQRTRAGVPARHRHFHRFRSGASLGAHHTVLIPFHPGFGDSGDSDAIDTVEDHVLQYMDLFDRLGLENFDLAGFSLGGWLAAEFAIRQPQRLRRLVLVAPPASWSTPRPRRVLFDIAPQDLPAYLAHDPLAAIALLSASARSVLRSAAGTRGHGVAKLIRNHPQGNPKLAHWLHRITIPTLVLWGAHDRLRPTAQAQAWMAGLPDGHLQLVPATGHLVFEETPDAGRHVTDFLAG